MSSVIIRSKTAVTNGLKVEAIRKGIHLLVAMVPIIAALDVRLAMTLVGAGTLFYVVAENARRSGLTIALVSDLTIIASREREKGHFVLGPVTLGLGAMLALTLYPLQASTIAIFALAFGDSVASLVGKTLGDRRVPFAAKKTLAGSVACFVVVTLLAGSLGISPLGTVLIAATATVLEAYAPDDMDNLLIPVGTGLVATFFS